MSKTQSDSDSGNQNNSPIFAIKKKELITDNTDSDGDLPLINVSHHFTPDRSFDESEYDNDNIPFIRCSQNTSTTISTSPNVETCENELLTSDSIHVPNAQKEKYYTKSVKFNESNQHSSRRPKQTLINKHFRPYQPPTKKSETVSQPEQILHKHQLDSPKFPPTSNSAPPIPKESTEGTYSLVSTHMKLSSL